MQAWRPMPLRGVEFALHYVEFPIHSGRPPSGSTSIIPYMPFVMCWATLGGHAMINEQSWHQRLESQALIPSRAIWVTPRRRPDP